MFVHISACKCVSWHIAFGHTYITQIFSQRIENYGTVIVVESPKYRHNTLFFSPKLYIYIFCGYTTNENTANVTY